MREDGDGAEVRWHAGRGGRAEGGVGWDPVGCDGAYLGIELASDGSMLAASLPFDWSRSQKTKGSAHALGFPLVCSIKYAFSLHYVCIVPAYCVH